MKNKSMPTRFWSALSIMTVLWVSSYVLMEWVFFVTKPSFIYLVSNFEKVKIFILIGFIFMLPLLGVVLVLSLLNFVFSGKVVGAFLAIAEIIPTTVLSILCLVMIDNFTYTVFKRGIVSSVEGWRVAYVALFLFIFINIYRYVRTLINSLSGNNWIYSEWARNLSLFLLVLPLLFTVGKIAQGNYQIKSWSSIATSQSGDLPNIILLGADGVDAAHMSVYGYGRDTTPYIRELVGTSLIAEKAFPNAGNTGSSLTSILTGKLPSQTHVIYPPDILTGSDSYEHLPGMLKQLGYNTFQLSVPYYGDANTMNFQNGFDFVNSRMENKNIFFMTAQAVQDGGSTYFAQVILDRITERLKHIFFIQTMSNPYTLVTEPTVGMSEEQRVDALLSILDEIDSPVFIHVHMLGTHGPLFQPRHQIFSLGDEQNEAWMTDFYDDAIMDFDRDVGKVFKHLSETGELKNTIIIVYSDHGKMWKTHTRVPLIFWFPNESYTGVVHPNAQNLDIAPTILDYLQVPQPDWMLGQSLLAGNLPQDRFVFSMNTADGLVTAGNDKLFRVDQTRISAPFYQLGYASLITCDQWYELYFVKPRILYGKIQGSTIDCDSGQILDVQQAKIHLLQNLGDNGYDISSYPLEIPIQKIDTQLQP